VRQSLTLTPDIPSPTLPAGFSLHDAPRPHQIEERVRIHHAAFNSEWVTVEGYQNVVRDPTYSPDLDIFILAPDGRFAAFCLAWADPITGVGDIEPVGVHPDFQRRGLGRAIMHEALRRLRDKGMTRAVLNTWTRNEPGLALYKSLGFEVIYDERAYKGSPIP
jgi:ribosomal protein S18 acetylase RimI-like enzyme